MKAASAPPLSTPSMTKPKLYKPRIKNGSPLDDNVWACLQLIACNALNNDGGGRAANTRLRNTTRQYTDFILKMMTEQQQEKFLDQIAKGRSWQGVCEEMGIDYTDLVKAFADEDNQFALRLEQLLKVKGMESLFAAVTASLKQQVDAGAVNARLKVADAVMGKRGGGASPGKSAKGAPLPAGKMQPTVPIPVNPANSYAIDNGDGSATILKKDDTGEVIDTKDISEATQDELIRTYEDNDR